MSKKKKILLTVFGIVGAYGLILLAVTILSGLFGGGINGTTFLIAGIIGAILLTVVLVDMRVRGSRRVLKVNVDLENSHFLTDKELKQNDGYTVTTFDELHTVKDGILLKAEMVNDKVNVVLKNPIHTLVIGATGTGKTSAYISPKIEILARTRTKPSLVVTDPKGELYAKHAATLKQEGYTVSVIDLSDPFHSTRWNPLSDIIRKTEQLKELNVTQRLGKYYVLDREYLTFAESEDGKRALKAEIESEIYIDLQDLVCTMCPIESKQDTAWERGARDLIFGIVLGFWEDLRDGYMSAEQFTLYNIYRTVCDYAKGDCDEFKKYVESREENSRVRGLTNTVLVSQDRTLASYLGNVNAYVTWLADAGITTLTSGSDIEFGDLDEKPNVLFLKIPDEKENRYKLVTVFATQLYKALVYKATLNVRNGKTNSQELLRHVYFLLDEFGNMPKFYNLDKIVTVGRSRGIFLVPVIQDFNQLDEKYGKAVAATVRSNCNIQVFIGTNDENTRKIFSEQCGKKRVKQVSYSENKDMSVSTSAQSVPLIYPSELERLNDPANKIFGNMIILSLGNYPMKSKVTPYFQAKSIYGGADSVLAPGDFIEIDEQAVRYDINTAATFIINDKAAIESEAQRAEEQPHIQETAQQIVSEQVLVALERERQHKKAVFERIERLRGRVSPSEIERLRNAPSDVARKDVINELMQNTSSPFLITDLTKLKQFISMDESQRSI